MRSLYLAGLLGAVSLPLLAPAEAQRDPWQQPFTSESVWNHPIGLDAEYVPAGLGPAADVDTDVVHLVRSQASFPLQPVYQQSESFSGDRCAGDELIPGLQFHLPDDFVVSNNGESPFGLTPNSAYALLLPDGETVFGGQRIGRCAPGTPAYLPSFMRWPANIEGAKASIYGDGLDGGGHGATGLSSLGGLVRTGELTGDAPIRHALKLMIWADRYAYYDAADETPGYRWPAKGADGYAEAQYGGTNPALEMGALLAIPPGVGEADLGLESVPGQKAFRALQDYGAYLTEDPAWDSHALTVSEAAFYEFEQVYGYSMKANDTPWGRDFNRLMQALHVIDNNAPGSVGGGGEPRAALLPPLTRLEAPAGETVCLAAEVNGQYVAAERAGAAPLIADRARCRDWERFGVEAVEGGAVALRAEANGRYVALQHDGRLRATDPAAGARSRFFWETASSDAVCLRSAWSGRYVAAEAAGEEPLVADRMWCRGWERFLASPAGVQAGAGLAAHDGHAGPLSLAAYPNPAAGRATVAFALPEAAEVRVAVYDVLGRRAALLAEGAFEAGRHEVDFDGSALPAGLYVVRLQAGAAVRTQRLTLAR